MVKNCCESGEREVFVNTSSQYSQATSSLIGGSSDSRWKKLKEGHTDLIELDENSASGGSIYDRVDELSRLVRMNQESIAFAPIQE